MSEHITRAGLLARLLVESAPVDSGQLPAPIIISKLAVSEVAGGVLGIVGGSEYYPLTQPNNVGERNHLSDQLDHLTTQYQSDQMAVLKAVETSADKKSWQPAADKLHQDYQAMVGVKSQLKELPDYANVGAEEGLGWGLGLGLVYCGINLAVKGIRTRRARAKEARASI